MDLIDGFFAAIESMQSWAFLLAFLIGCLNGIVFGMLPGLSGSVGIALMIPFTYSMSATEAMALFVAALSGQTFAGSIAAILLNTPGTSPNAATTFDGYPLARQGRGGFAIGISATSSFVGSLIGVVLLIALFPLMRPIILAFSTPEFTMLGVLGLAAIAVASRGSLLKGLMSGLLGLAISFVGFSPIGGDLRYVFGQPTLYDGISIVAVLIGLFALTEALRLVVGNQTVAKDVSQLRFGRRQVWEGVGYTFRQPFLLVRSALLGTGVGIVPAVGGTLASFLAYFQAAKTVKNPRFGTGDPRGVLAPEAANDAKDAGAALPTLAFGIPGSADWAIILGAMVIHGITPGPNLIREAPDVVWIAILVIVAASFISSAIGIAAAPKLIQVTRIRSTLLAPVVIVLAITGAFGLELRVVDVLVAVAFGLIGFLMRVVGMPAIPLILGLVLGTMVERSYLQSLSLFGGPSVFLTRPISLVIVILIVAIVAYEIWATRRERRRNPGAIAAGVQEAVRPASLALVGGVAVVAAFGFVQALGFNEQSRQFPLLTTGLLFVLAALYLLVGLVPGLRRRFGAVIADTGGMESMTARIIEEEEHEAAAKGAVTGSAATAPVSSEGPADGAVVVAEVETPTVAPPVRAASDARRRGIISFALLGALALGTPYLGLPIMVVLVLPLFFLLVGRESLRTTIIMTVATLIPLYLLFVELLGMPLDGGSLISF